MTAIFSQVTFIFFILFLATVGALLLIKVFYKKFKILILKSQKEVQQEFRYSLQPRLVQIAPSTVDLIDLAVEVWRVSVRIEKVAPEIQEVQRKGIETSLQKLKRHLDRYDLEVVDYTGQKYNEGLNLDVLNVEKDASVTVPTVKETVEPTVLHKGQVVKKAKIILLSN